MRKFSWITLLIALVIIATASAIFALVIREIQTRLTAGDVEITIDGLHETVNLDGPIDFSHDGHSIMGDSGVLELERDEGSENRTPLHLTVNGNIKYSDENGYSASCANADFNFKSDVVKLTGKVSLSGNDMLLKSSRLTYERRDEKISADGFVHYEAKTRRIPLLVDSESPDEIVTYTIDCTRMVIDGKSQTVIASGDVNFKLETTAISCSEAILDYDKNEIIKVVCEGNVEFNDPDMNGKADKVIYSRDEGKLILQSISSSSDVVVVYKGQEVKGKRVVLDLNHGREITLDEGQVSIKPEE
ncbi:hypothetical protein J7L05_01385 [bacterium]|nr:hypothetical protein [bacterium]